MIETTVNAAPQLDAASFRDLITYVRPKSEESKWLEIPWQTDLWEGRRMAMAEGKPIFLWAMNGNPLGCT
ncbi:MAG: hypothetical protein ACR2JY_17475 [Chloroflexota bacterium]